MQLQVGGYDGVGTRRKIQIIGSMEFDSSLGDGNNYLDMDGQEIQNLKYPTDSSDAANKKYVDDELFSGSFISSSMTSSMSVATASYVENAQTASYITTAQTASYIEASNICLLYTSPSPRDGLLSRMPSSA